MKSTGNRLGEAATRTSPARPLLILRSAACGLGVAGGLIYSRRGSIGSLEGGRVEFRILGPLEVVRGEERLELGTARQQAVLAVLVLHAPRPVSIERLVDEVWGEQPPASAHHAVQVYVSQIRKVLRAAGGVAAVRTTSAGYALELDRERVDARRFERLVDEGQRALGVHPRRARELFGEALVLWRGPPLTGFERLGPAGREAARLEELRSCAAEGVIEAELALGADREVVGAISAIVAADPLREQPRRLLMLALYRSGRQAEALSAYRDACVALGEIGLRPGPELRALEQAILRHDPDLVATQPAREERSAVDALAADDLRSMTDFDLPAAPGPLVGRGSELASIRELLARSDVRLVTLLGAGGSGKTRLALEIASALRARYRDGARFVSLAPLSDPGLVAWEIAHAVGVKETEDQPLQVALWRALAKRELLLVLDNFEHLIPAAGVVSGLLDAAPSLDVLVTSREALRLRGEHRMEVAPLPPADAAELFLARARAVRPDLDEGARQREAVERICQRLDGLPLALELAAARVAMFSVRAREDRLAGRLELPVCARDLPDRQRTLRATIDWSYRLLSATERALFRGLAPFAGGARLEAIESVFADLALEPLDLVAALVDKSLLRRRDDRDGLPRFWMLDTIREYASECLAAHPEADTMPRRHAEYYCELAEQAERNIHSADQQAVLERLEADHDNLRAAFDYLLTVEPSGALRLASALGLFWEIRGHLSEGRERLERALSCAPDGRATAMATFHAGRLAMIQGEQDEPMFSEALRLAREFRDTRAEVLALTHLGVIALSRGDVARSEELHEEALAVARRGADQWTLGHALNDLGSIRLEAGEPERARPLLAEALELSRRLGEPYGTAMVTGNLAELALQRDDLDAAAPLIAECLHNAREIHDESLIAWALTLGALVALNRGALDTAERRMNESGELLRAAYERQSGPLVLAAAATLAAARSEPLLAAQLWAALEHEMGQHLISESFLISKLRTRWLADARSAADAAEWDAAWQSGSKLTAEQALELAATPAKQPPVARVSG